ncbi:MAG TPA: DUF3048 domain-containing protein [Thermomicrobiaceae bacterium]|nr:DUF3048 domain-containing protein [Thermomicrobiaceae bacterium]
MGKRLIGILALVLVMVLVVGVAGILHRTPAVVTPPAAAIASPPTAEPTPVPTPSPTDTPTPTPTPEPTATPTPTPVPTPNPVAYLMLTGAPAATPPPRPIAVQIDNAPSARPQSGLVDADVVYETPTEAQLTRFTALFQTHAPDVVGPVRSARLIDLQVIPEHDAILTYSGAATAVQALLVQARLDLLQAEIDASSVSWRDLNRYAPYNLYTSVKGLLGIVAQRGWATPSTADPFVFGPAAPSGSPSGGVDVPYAAGEVEFRYDPATQRYRRFVDGAPHLDAVTGAQIAAQNVVVVFTTFTQTNIIEDTLGERSLDVTLQGSGDAWVFRGGQRYVARWQRSGLNDTLRFVDATTGLPVPLAEGQTWICLVPQWLTATPKP